MFKLAAAVLDAILSEYIDEALKCALYEIIEDEEPYYGEIP